METAVTLSYLGSVNIAVREVKEKYPESSLYEVDGTSSTGPTTNPNDINNLRAVFTGGDNNTIMIFSTTWGEWGNMKYIDQPWMGDVIIPWPIEMDIVNADELLKAAGYTGAYNNCTLRHPLYPGSNQPLYIFGMAEGGFIAVGVNDKSVKPIS